MATCLLNLHDDALLSITDNLDPRDLARLSQCSRRSHSLLSPYLPAAKLTHSFSDVNIECLAASKRNGARWPHPAWLMHRIHEDPRVLRHVRKLVYSNDGWASAGAGAPTTRMIDACNDQRYVDAYHFLAPDDKRKWKAALAAGNPEVTLVVLLSLCRDLRVLCFRHVHWEGEGRFLHTYIEAAMPTLSIASPAAGHSSASSASPAPPTPLTHAITSTPTFSRALTRLELIRSHPISKLAHLLLIPSLRELVGQLDEDSRFSWPAGRDGECQLRRVQLTATISPRNLAELVRGMPRLAQLTYVDLFNFVRFRAPELPLEGETGHSVDGWQGALCTGAFRLDAPPKVFLNHFVAWAGLVLHERGLVAGLREWYQHEMRRGMLIVGETERVLQWTRPGASLPML